MSLVGEGLTSFRRINHRMHNKTWIADNRIAIVGCAISVTSTSTRATR